MIITLTGENEAMRQNKLSQLITDFKTAYSDISIERIDGETATYDHIAAAVQSLPFLSPRKLVVLRAPSANKEFLEKIEAFIAAVADTSDVVIVEPKLDRRLTYYRQLKKQTDFNDFSRLDSNGLARAIVGYATARDARFMTADAHFLIERVGVDQLMLENEVDKLIAYSPNITRSSIELLTEKTPQSTIFDLLDAAFSGDVKKTLRLYDEQRALKIEPQQIIAMLAWQLLVIAIIATAKQRSSDEIARDAKLNPYVVKKTQGLARRLSIARLRHFITELRELDIRTKTQAVSSDEALRYYLIVLTAQSQ